MLSVGGLCGEVAGRIGNIKADGAFGSAHIHRDSHMHPIVALATTFLANRESSSSIDCNATQRDRNTCNFQNLILQALPHATFGAFALVLFVLFV